MGASVTWGHDQCVEDPFMRTVQSRRPRICLQMGDGESSSRSYGQQSTFSAGSNTKTSNFNMEHAHAAFIPDNYGSLDQVISTFRDDGLESSNLILGIDFTESNKWTGQHSFNRRSLHALGNTPNPYEQAISIIGRTLSPFDEDNLIPCFGFGDASTHDQHIFSFYPDHRSCHGFEVVLARYKEILPFIRLSGPTSFAPLIHASIDIVEKSNWQYHVLVIIADSQVTRSSDNPHGSLSPQERATIEAIVAASDYPLSIIMVGVGDGPWDVMQQFDDYIPQRSFDNFQFVNFTKIMSTNMVMENKEAAFAFEALKKIPFQYKATQSLTHIENKEIKLGPSPLPPPCDVFQRDTASTPLPSASTSSAEQVCPICLTNPRDMAFGCGHMICEDCGSRLSACPMCRAPITTRLRLLS